MMNILFKAKKVNLLISFLLLIVFFKPINAEEEKSYLYNDPEYYKQIRAERIKRIAETRESMDLQTIDRFRTEISQTDSHIIIKRQTWEIDFNKLNGMVDKVYILDRILDDNCLLPDIEITDSKGNLYRQSYSKNANVSVDDQKFHYLLTAQFNPATKQGQYSDIKFEVQYDLFKVSGMITVRYKVIEPGKTSVSKLDVVNTLGKVKPSLDILNIPWGANNDGSSRYFTFAEIPANRKGLITAGKLPYIMWTNGRIGFQVAPRRYTWDQMNEFDDPKAKTNRMRAEIINGAHRSTLRFVDRKNGISLKTGQMFDLLFAFLPCRKPGPVKVVSYANPNRGSRSGDNLELENREFRDIAGEGAMMTMSGLYQPGGANCWYGLEKGPYHDNFHKSLSVIKKYGLEFVPFRTTNQVMYWQEFLEKDKPIPQEDWDNIMKEPWSKTTSSFETAEIREAFLDMNCSQFITNLADGIYEDLHWCYVAEPQLTPQIEGTVRYAEDMYFLCHSFEPAKYHIMHSSPASGIMESVPDVIWPGEHLTSASVPELGRAMLDSLYNPFLIGPQVMGYSDGNICYDYTSPTLVKQFYRNGIIADMKYYGEGTELDAGPAMPPHYRKAWNKYFLPLVAFDVRNCDIHFWRETEAGEWFKTGDKNLKLNIYCREGELLVTGSRMGEKKTSKCKINISNLGLKAEEVFVYDVLANEPKVVKADRNGWIELDLVNLDTDPVIICVKEKHGDTPQIIWSDENLLVRKTRMEKGEFIVDMALRAIRENVEYKTLIIYSGTNGNFGPGWSNCMIYRENYWPEVAAVQFEIALPGIVQNEFANRPVTGPAYREFEQHFKWETSNVKDGAAQQVGFYYPE